MTDRIVLSGIEFFAHGGVSAQEKVVGQRYRAHVELEIDLDRASQSDDLRDTVHYGEVHNAVVGAVQSRQFNLLESAAATVAARILENFPVHRVTVELQKLLPPIDGVVDYASVRITRARHR